MPFRLFNCLGCSVMVFLQDSFLCCFIPLHAEGLHGGKSCLSSSISVGGPRVLCVTSTGLLSGVRLTSCCYALVHLGWVPQLPSRKLRAFDFTSPLNVRAHSTRSIATSKALLSRVSSKRCVMQQAGPLCTHSSDSITWIWTLHQGLKCFRPKLCSE